MKFLLSSVLITLITFTGLVAASPPVKNEGPTLKLPAKVSGDVASFIVIAAETNGKVVKWKVLDAGLNIFPTTLLKDSKTAVFTTGKTGVYRVVAITAVGDELSEFAECSVEVGKQPTPPGPTPPGPTPPTPDPDNPAPIPADGFRVLIVYESADLSKLPANQQSALFSRKVRDYLDSKCVQDGQTKAWRVWDKDIDVVAESRLWQDAMKREKKTLPWIIISNGKTGFEGPLPENADKTLELLKKFGGA